MSQLLPEHEDQLRSRIAELGLTDFTHDIIEGAFSGYWLVGEQQEASQERGTTRFGGDPDVPGSFDTNALENLEFIYQVRLTDLPQASKLGLPDVGLLSVFSDCDADSGVTYLFENGELTRHRMPESDPEYIFSQMKPWRMRVVPGVDIPGYGDDIFDAIEDAGLEDAFEQLGETDLVVLPDLCFGQILGLYSDLNGDMRDEAADECGGHARDWVSLWKVFSSFESGLVISDFHLLHGMALKHELMALDAERMYSTSSNG